MPILWVPDDQVDDWPDSKAYKISPSSKKLLDSELMKFVNTNWDALGSGKTSDLPDPGSVAQVSQIDISQLRSKAVSNYTQTSSELKGAFNSMQVEIREVVKASTKDAKEDRLQYKDGMTKFINTLSGYAEKAPDNGLTMDDYIRGYVADGLLVGEKIYKDFADKMSATALKIKEQTKTIETLTQGLKDEKARGDKLEKEVEDLKKKGTGTGTGSGTGNPYDPGPAQPVGTGNGNGTGTGADDAWKPIDLGADGSSGDGSSNGTGTGGSDGTGTGGSDGTGTGSGSTGSGNSGYPVNPTPADTSSTPYSGMGTGVGSSGLGDMMNQLGPWMQQLQQQEMMRRMLDQNNNPYGQVQQQPTVAQPAAAAPQAQAQAPATTTSGTPASSTTPAPGTSSSQTGQGQPGGPVPGRTPGTDGKVDYPFPNGEVQRVWAVAALGLDAAFGNQGGTDAQAAYEKTPAKWSDKKQIGKSVDPNDMVTGDVAVWKDRTAVVAKFGTPEAGGRLEAIIDGKLQELTSDNLHQISDTAGEFGEFSGWFHPPGIEAPVAGDQSGHAPGGAPTGDQSGTSVLAATGGAPV
ncbi:hypothetical protein [Nocardia sp. CA-119907]|uniref:hypothetical protein n=1 Tax=Nocardia sp. CA-119907 TaxID=3239973 RepID=UPI003D966BA5